MLFRSFHMSNTCETRREKNGEKQGENRTLTVEKTVTMIGYSDHKSPFPSARKLNIGTKTCIQLLQKEDDVCYCYDVFHTKKSHIRVPYPTYLTSCFSRVCSKKHAKSTNHLYWYYLPTQARSDSLLSTHTALHLLFVFLPRLQ